MLEVFCVRFISQRWPFCLFILVDKSSLLTFRSLFPQPTKVGHIPILGLESFVTMNGSLYKSCILEYHSNLVQYYRLCMHTSACFIFCLTALKGIIIKNYFNMANYRKYNYWPVNLRSMIQSQTSVIIADMKKIKERAKKNAIKNNAPTNISIALNINSPLISHHNLQNIASKQEKKNRMKMVDASQQETLNKSRRKVIFEQKASNAHSCKDETDEVESIQALDSIDRFSKTFLANKTNEDKGYRNQMGTRLVQTRNCVTDRQKSTNKSSTQLNTGKRNYQFNVISTDKSHILESQQLTKQLSTIQNYRYKSQHRSKTSNHKIGLQRNAHSTHNRHFSTNLEKASIQTTRNKHKKVSSDKRQISTCEQNLKQKLQQFRIDILKLQEAYQQSEIYKSKASMSSRSPAFEFGDDHNGDDNESEGLHQIRLFERKYNSEISQKFLDKQDQVGENQSQEQKKIATLKLVQYYQKYHQDQSDEQRNFSLLSLVQPIKVQQNHWQQFQSITNQQYQKLQFNLQKSIAQMKKNSIDLSSANKSIVQSLIKSNKQKQLDQSALTNKIYQQQPIGNIISEDLQIDRQIERIQKQKRKLARQLDLQDQNWIAIDDWSDKYRVDLLKLKKKMWGQYQVIRKSMKKEIYHIKTPQKLMKSLSQNCISYHFSEDKSIQDLSSQVQQVSLKNTIDHGDNSLLRMKQQYHLVIQDEQLSQDHSEVCDIQLLQSLNFHPQSTIPINKTSDDKVSKLKSATRAQKDELKQIIISQLIQQFCRQFIDKWSSQVSKVIYRANFLNQLKSVKRKGFQTGLNAVKVIAQQLSKLFTMNKCISDSSLSIKQQILENLNKPCGPTTNQILRSLRYDSFVNKPTLTQNVDEMQQIEVLSVQVFHQFQLNYIKIKELSFERYFEDEERQQQRVLSLRNYVHIHHKAIFDSFNEALDQSRIFGIWGKPFAWKLKPSFEKIIEQPLLPNIIERCKKRVSDNCKIICGLLLDKENSLVKNYQNQPQLIQQLRQERAQKLLEDYNNEMNERWLFVDDDETEILLELTHAVWRRLIGQIAKEILTIAFLKHI